MNNSPLKNRARIKLTGSPLISITGRNNRIDLRRQSQGINPVVSPHRAQNAQRLIRHLYGNPAITLTEIENVLEINRNPARELIAGLEKIGVLEEITGFKRNRIFLFRRYLDIFRDHKIGSRSSEDTPKNEL